MRRTTDARHTDESDQSWLSTVSENEEDEDYDHSYSGATYRPYEEGNRQGPRRVSHHVARTTSRPPPSTHQEPRNLNATSKPVEKQQQRTSFDPRYHKGTEPVSRQQPSSYASRGPIPGNTHYASNSQINQSHHPTSFGHQNQTPGYGHYMPSGGTASHYQPWAYYQFPNSSSYYWPMQYTTPPPPPPPPSTEEQPPVTAPPQPPPDRELLALKEELKEMKELTKRAKDAETRKQMEEQIRKEVEDEFQCQLEHAKEAQERAREEIEKIRTETEITTRKKILAERHAQAERERLEAQQAIRFEKEVRLKVEQERAAEEAAKEARARQREEFEILMREKMLQNMEELTAMAKGKMMLEIGTGRESSSKAMDVKTNDGIVINETSVKERGKEKFSKFSVNEYQESDEGVEEQDVCRQSPDTTDVLEEQTSTSRSESQKPHDRHHSRFHGGDKTTREQDYSTGEDLESEASLDHSRNASVNSGAAYFSFKKSGAYGDEVPPPAPDIPGMSDEDDWKSSSSRGSRLSYRPRRNRRPYDTYSDYSMDDGQHFHPEYQSQGYHRCRDYYQGRYPYQDHHQEYPPYPEHQDHRRYIPEDFSYPVSNPYPAQMGELVEQVIDGVLSRLHIVSGPDQDLKKAGPFSKIESFSRVKTVSSVSASDVDSAHSEAATLQSHLCESTRGTSISDGHVSDAKLRIEGGVLLMENNLKDGPKSTKSQTQLHIDVAAVTAAAACHDEEEFHTPTE